MTTIARHPSRNTTPIRKHAWTQSPVPQAPVPPAPATHRTTALRHALSALGRHWRRGGEMSRSIDGLREAAWKASGAGSYRLW